MDSNGDAESETGASRSSARVPYADAPQRVRGSNAMALATTTQATTSPRHDGLISMPAWTPGTIILDLPNELLRDIFLGVDEAFSCTLWSLSLTCKQFRAIVEEHCEPEYNLRGIELDNSLELLQQLIDRPHLKHSIRVLNVQYRQAFGSTETLVETKALATRLGVHKSYHQLSRIRHNESDRSSNTAAALLAACLPNLETWHVGMPNQGPADFDHIIGCLILGGQPFGRLRNLTICNSSSVKNSYCESVSHTLCELPSLMKLKIQGIYFGGAILPAKSRSRLYWNTLTSTSFRETSTDGEEKDSSHWKVLNIFASI